MSGPTAADELRARVAMTEWLAQQATVARRDAEVAYEIARGRYRAGDDVPWSAVARTHARLVAAREAEWRAVQAEADARDGGS